MADWCLRDVYYDTIDFSPRRRNSSKVRGRQDDSFSDSGLESLSSPRSSVVGRGGLPSHDADDVISPRSDVSSVSTGITWVVENFRDVIQNTNRHHEIPNIIANWPSSTFRLQAIVSQAELEQCLDSPDHMWQHLFHGLLLTTSYCKITCIDLTGFIPSKGLLYTVLQLVPLLSLTPDNLDRKVIFDLVVTKLGLTDSDLLRNLDRYLETSLGHRVYKRGKQIKFPEGYLDVMLDHVPLAADRLNHMCLLTAVGIREMTRVNILPKSIVYSYVVPSSEFCPMDSMAPLVITNHSLITKRLSGLCLEDVPGERTAVLLEKLSNQYGPPTFPALLHLSIRNCGISLASTDKHIAPLTSLLSSLSSLRRLDLTGAYLGGLLGKVLQEIPSTLEYLSLAHCQLDWEDLDGLAQCNHRLRLRDLNLAYIHPEPCSVCRGEVDTPGVERLSGGSSLDSSGDSTPPARPGSLPGYTDSDDSEDWAGVSWNSGRDGRATPCEHETMEANYYKRVVTMLKSFPNLVLLDVSSSLCQFRLDQETLLILLDGVAGMTKLKQMGLEGVPLWNDEIFSLVGAASDHPSLHSLTLTRSLDAPSLQMTDKFDFWKTMHRAKRGKFIKTAIGNFVDDYLCDMPDSDDERSVFESISSLEL